MFNPLRGCKLCVCLVPWVSPMVIQIEPFQGSKLEIKNIVDPSTITISQSFLDQGQHV